MSKRNPKAKFTVEFWDPRTQQVKTFTGKYPAGTNMYAVVKHTYPDATNITIVKIEKL